jgi:hypothetical protein
MPTPIEAYRQGYEKGRSDSAGGRLAEVTMGMLRDDPGGHFQKGYCDGAAGKPFSPPSIPEPSRRRPNELIPKFSENPMGWFLGVLIVIELWTLWQLIKAPFQLVGSLMRSEKPSPWVIVKNVIVVGLVIALVWWVPHANEMRGPGRVAANQQFTTSPPGATAPGSAQGPGSTTPPKIPRGPAPSTNTERLVDSARQEIVNGNTDDAAPLIRQVAASHGNLDYKQDVSLLYVAIANQHMDIATLLLDLGASPDVGDSYGQTPLMQAVLDGNADEVDFLLAHKANPNLATRSGETALQFALKNTFPVGQRIVMSLRRAGAQH